MDHVVLNPLSEQRRSTYTWPTSAEHEAREVVEGRRSPERARMFTRRQHSALLAAIRQNPSGYHLYSIHRDDGEESGTACVQEIPTRSTWWVHDVFVDGASRRQGLGKATLSVLEDRARELGLQFVRSRIFASDPVGMSLFLGSGYQREWLVMSTDPRCARLRRAPKDRLREMAPTERRAFLRRHGVDPSTLTGPLDLALAGPRGKVRLKLAHDTDGTVATLHFVEDVGSWAEMALMLTAVVRTTHERDISMLMVTMPAVARWMFDDMAGVDWRIEAVQVVRDIRSGDASPTHEEPGPGGPGSS